MLKCSSGSSLEKLKEYPAVLELGGRNWDVQDFVTIMLFTSLLREKISSGKRGELRHVLIFDECKRIFDINLEKNYLMGIPPIDLLVSHAREYGQGLILADQEPTKLTNSIKANSKTKISFKVGGEEIREVQKMLCLDASQTEVLTQLPRGTAIVRMDGQYPMPFITQFNHMPLEEEVSDEEVSEHNRHFVGYLNKDVRSRSTFLVKKIRLEKAMLSEEAKIFLIDTVKHPYRSVVERTVLIGFSNYKSNNVVRELEIKGYAVKRKIVTGLRGRPVVLLDPTRKGWNHLQGLGIKQSRSGKGGIIHNFWQHVVKKHAQSKGKKAIIEPNTKGANTDVLFIDQNGQRTAVEIALSSKNQIENIRRDLEYFDRVMIAAETKTLLSKIEDEAKKTFSDEELKSVGFCLLQDFLE